MKESIIQQHICEYLSVKGIFFFSIPNEHYGISHGQRMTLKKMGLVPGMPDLCILKDGRSYFLEVKNEKGLLTDEQLRIHRLLRYNVFPIEVVRSVEDVEIFLKTWGLVK